MLHAVRLNERLTFKTFWLRQSETSSENTQKWPETTKRLQTVYRVIYHTRTIISQPKNANIVNVEFSLVKSILIFNLISFSLSLLCCQHFLDHVRFRSRPYRSIVRICLCIASFESQMQLHRPASEFFFYQIPETLHLANRIRFSNAAALCRAYALHICILYCIGNQRLSDRKTFTPKWMSYTWYKQFDLDRRRTTTGCPKINAIEIL